MLHPAGGILELVGTFDLRNRLSLRAIKDLYEFGLFALEIGLPDHSQRVTTSSSKVVSIFGESTCIGAAIVTIEGILKDTFIDFPNFDFGIERSGDHEVIFGMEIDLGDWLTMSIVILYQSFTTQIIKFYFFISCATGQAGAV